MRKASNGEPEFAARGNLFADKVKSTAMKTESSQARTMREDLLPSFRSSLEDFESSSDLDPLPAQKPDLVLALLEDALRARASDIHVEPHTSEVCIRLRIDGSIIDVARLTHTQARWLSNQIKAIADLDPIVRFTPKDAHATVNLNGVLLNLRLALAPAQSGEAMAIRLLDTRRLERSVDDLGLSGENMARLREWTDSVSGMFLAAGPTGTGKTTTIYAMLHELKYADRVIVSLEDPVEYQVDGIVQVQLDERHHLNFAEGVKSMLRLDPDYLMMGEIRDSASAHAAVNAAISGRVLLSTMHCRDAVGAVTALRNWGLTDQEIAESLGVVVAQRLVRKLCSSCRKAVEPTSSESNWLKALNLPAPKQVWHAAGCAACQEHGYFGRTGIFELWKLDEMDYTSILNHVDEHTLRSCLAQKGHRSLIEDGMDKVTAAVTSISELRRITGGLPGSTRAPQTDLGRAAEMGLRTTVVAGI